MDAMLYWIAAAVAIVCVVITVWSGGRRDL
jgi:hypothetical protein